MKDEMAGQEQDGIKEAVIDPVIDVALSHYASSLVTAGIA